MKNPILTQGEVRQPRGIVVVNGVALPTCWTDFSFDENEFSQPDTFDVQIAMSLLPRENDLRWWAAQTEIEVQLYTGFPADPDRFTTGDLQRVFIGNVDTLSFDWVQRTIGVTGRDRTAKLMDSKTSEKYVNLTSSQIAVELATKYGLKPIVTTTRTKAGKYYQIDHVDLKMERTEWDLLTWLARQEQFVTFVRGAELHFRPKPTASQDPYVLRHEPPTDGPGRGNYATLRTSRTLTVAKGVEVTVKSWNGNDKKTYTKKSTRLPRNGRRGDVQKYSYNIAGLTPEQAQAKADQIRDEISRHEMLMDVTGPADNLLTIDDAVLLQGTDTDFDQVYYPASIVRTMSASSGYDWTVSLKNHSPEDQPTL